MGLSIWQILIIVGVILLLFGGRKIPQLMKDMGSGITSFKKGLKEGSDEEGKTAAKPGEPPVIEAEKSKTTAAAASAKTDEAKKA